MSLDVSILSEQRTVPCQCECGHEHTKLTRDALYNANITHNLSKMAQEAGIYEHLWRPEEIGITRTQQLIEPLTAGLALLESDPERFKALDSPNGWGRYEHLVSFVRDYLAACKRHPNAEVFASR